MQIAGRCQSNVNAFLISDLLFISSFGRPTMPGNLTIATYWKPINPSWLLWFAGAAFLHFSHFHIRSMSYFFLSDFIHNRNSWRDVIYMAVSIREECQFWNDIPERQGRLLGFLIFDVKIEWNNVHEMLYIIIITEDEWQTLDLVN